MKLTTKKLKILRWTARILAVATLLFGLPFYFGYGNPLPFINPEYTLWDNMWLSIFPLMFLGLALGWKFEKTGGYLISIPLVIGLLAGLIMQGEFIGFMCVPLVIGILYLIAGYSKKQ
jgi:hypothetical protein